MSVKTISGKACPRNLGPLLRLNGRPEGYRHSPFDTIIGALGYYYCHRCWVNATILFDLSPVDVAKGTRRSAKTLSCDIEITVIRLRAVNVEV